MKISKSLLQAIAVAVAISTTASSCIKDDITQVKNPEGQKKIENHDSCPGCGMG